MALVGIMKKWHGDKGFGFIEPRDGNEDIFCHVSDLLDGEGSIMEGDEVRYSEKYDDRKGKYRATEVELDNRRGGGGGGGGGGRSGRGRRPPDDVSRSPPPRGGKKDSDSGMKNGILLRWNAEKGFGFIQPGDGSEDIFCHVSALIDGEGSVTDGDDVTYFKEFNDRKGKYQAVDVQRARGAGHRGGGDRDRSPRGDRRDERSRDVRDYGGRDRDDRGGRDGDRDRRGSGREYSRRDDRRESDRRDYESGGRDFDDDKGRGGRGRDYDRGSGRDYDRDTGRGSDRNGGRDYVRSSRY